MSVHGKSRQRFVGEMLLLAAGYWLAGRAAILLAIPPGYATAVWPAAGIAAGVLLTRGRRLWPGVLAGSFAVNVGTSFDPSSPATIAVSLAVAIGIAAGAAAQGVIAARLVERHIGWPHPLLEGSAVARFILLAGPVACLLNAVIGPGVLLAGGRIAWPDLPFSIFTWWAGDTIGVLIAAPLVVIGLGRPRADWRRRLPAVAVPLLAALAVVLITFVLARGWERERIRMEFSRRASVQHQALTRALDGHIEALVSVGALFTASESVSPAEFRTFVEHGVLRRAGLQAVSWVPRVTAGAATDDAPARAPGGVEITELGPEGGLVPAGRRTDYFPVTYIEPPAGNEPAVGFDLASDPVRRRALVMASATGRTCATAPLRLVQETGSAAGFLFASPVRQGSTGGTAGEVRGFATAAFRIEDLVAAALDGLDRAGMGLEILDITDDGPAVRLLAAEEFLPRGTADAAPGSASLGEEIPDWITEIETGGRRWRLRFPPTLEFLSAHQTWHAWMVLAGGLLFTSLFGAFLLFVSGRAAADAQRNARLAALVAELGRSNADLENFAYVASHDLQEPLRKVQAFGDLLRTRFAGAIPGEALDILERMEGAASRMRTLITDLLEFSRITSQGQPFAEVDLTASAAAALSDLEPLVATTGGSVRIGRLPRIRADAGQMHRLFQNLIANALKFHRPGVPPAVGIRAEAADPDRAEGGGTGGSGTSFRLIVEDNGIGVAAEHRERIFLPFQRLNRRESYEGTGMGLAICRRIVERHGGSIAAEGTPAGSMFIIDLPMTREAAAGGRRGPPHYDGDDRDSGRTPRKGAP